VPVVVFAISALLGTGDPAPEVSRLDNGLQLVVIRDTREARVSVQLWFRVGSGDDGDRYPGLCEVIRRLLERGLDVPAPLRADEVAFESRTLRDACYFAWSLPRSLLDDALRVEAQRFAIPLPLGEGAGGGFESHVPNPLPTLPLEGGGAAMLLAAAFAGHPYQSPPGFVADAVKSLSPADLDEFRRRWFVPGNATLLVIGDVQPPTVREAIRRYFGELPWAEPSRRASRPLPAAERVQLPALPADRAGLDVAWVTPGAADGENAALAVLMQRLCNAVDGPLYRRLTKAGCLPPRWRQHAGRLAGLTVLSVDAERDMAGEIAALVQEGLERAAQAVPAEIELNRARALAGRAVRLQQARFVDRALRLGFYEVVAGDVLLAGWELPCTLQVTVGDLQRAAADLCRARTVYLPRVAGAGEIAPVPPAVVRVMDSTPASASLALADGVHVTVCRQPAAPLVEVCTLVGGATGLTEALAVLMAVGWPHHTAEQFRDYLTYHGLDLIPLVEGLRPGLVSRGPVTHVAQMIELHAEQLRSALGVRPAMRPIDIIVTGDVGAHAACDAARGAWKRGAPPSP
jgi:zinc protease